MTQPGVKVETPAPVKGKGKGKDKGGKGKGKPIPLAVPKRTLADGFFALASSSNPAVEIERTKQAEQATLLAREVTLQKQAENDRIRLLMEAEDKGLDL